MPTLSLSPQDLSPQNPITLARYRTGRDQAEIVLAKGIGAVSVRTGSTS